MEVHAAMDMSVRDLAAGLLIAGAIAAEPGEQGHGHALTRHGHSH
jgi:hypothetical protein